MLTHFSAQLGLGLQVGLALGTMIALLAATKRGICRLLRGLQTAKRHSLRIHRGQGRFGHVSLLLHDRGFGVHDVGLPVDVGGEREQQADAHELPCSPSNDSSFTIWSVRGDVPAGRRLRTWANRGRMVRRIGTT